MVHIVVCIFNQQYYFEIFCELKYFYLNQAPLKTYNETCFKTFQCLTQSNLTCSNSSGNQICDCSYDNYWSITSSSCCMLIILTANTVY
jgi:hypothetical protein